MKVFPRMTARAQGPGERHLPLYFSQTLVMAWGMPTGFLTGPTYASRAVWHLGESVSCILGELFSCTVGESVSRCAC